MRELYCELLKSAYSCVMNYFIQRCRSLTYYHNYVANMTDGDGILSDIPGRLIRTGRKQDYAVNLQMPIVQCNIVSRWVSQYVNNISSDMMYAKI